MKKSTIILLGVFLLLVAIIAVSFWVRYEMQFRISRPHVYELAEQPKFLDEVTALSFAEKSIEEEGLAFEAWKPVHYGKTKSPDDRVDEYFSRNVLTTNEGTIMFTNGTARMRIVAVRLESGLRGGRIVCRTWILK